MPKPGDAAPDFVLQDADGKDVRLSQMQGHPVVLYFYPKDQTLGCTIEAKGFRDHMAGFTQHGAAVVGVSMDPPEAHCVFRDRHALPFHLLSDPDGRVHDLYDAWLTTLFGKNRFVVRRCTYVIDAAGIIRKVYRRVNPVGHAADVLRQVQRLATPG